jgi:DNA-binding transcriptional LysR family regulator
MDKLRALQYFIAAAEEGSLSGAARRFEVSIPAISKLISSLERNVGASLFDRTSHGLSLTPDGERYLESCRPLLEQLADADLAVSAAATRPRGVLVVGTPPFVMQNLLVGAIPQFHARFPEIQLDFRMVSGMADAEAASVDVFVLFGWHDAPDLVQKQIAQTRYHVTAAPEYWAAHGVPERPRDLANHACLLFRGPRGTLMDLWQFERRGAKESVAVSGWLASSHRDLLVDAALAGEGVLRLTSLAMWRHLASGRLVAVLKDWTVLEAPPVNVLYRPKQRRTPRVRVFVDFVTELFGKLGAQSGEGLPLSTAPPPQWYGKRYGRSSSSIRR